MPAPDELPKVFTKDQVKALLQVPNLDAPTGLRNRCMLELMYALGLRVTETCLLELRDVDWSEGRLHLRAATTKNGKEAYLTVPARLDPLLERWKSERRRHTTRRQPHLFTTLRGGPVGRKYVWSMIGRYARRAELELGFNPHPHVLRHSFATHLLQDGFDIREVQRLMRHDDIRTTLIYTHVDGGQLHRRLRDR